MAELAAFFLQVSTDEQTAGNLGPGCLRVTAERPWDVAHVYREHHSVVRGRPIFDWMMADARGWRFEVLIDRCDELHPATCRATSTTCSQSTEQAFAW